MGMREEFEAQRKRMFEEFEAKKNEMEKSFNKDMDRIEKMQAKSSVNQLLTVHDQFMEKCRQNAEQQLREHLFHVNLHNNGF